MLVWGIIPFSYQIYVLFTRHADIPESCLRYMGAMVDDVIILDHEVRKPLKLSAVMELYLKCGVFFIVLNPEVAFPSF